MPKGPLGPLPSFCVCQTHSPHTSNLYVHRTPATAWETPHPKTGPCARYPPFVCVRPTHHIFPIFMCIGPQPQPGGPHIQPEGPPLGVISLVVYQHAVAISIPLQQLGLEPGSKKGKQEKERGGLKWTGRDDWKRLPCC